METRKVIEMTEEELQQERIKIAEMTAERIISKMQCNQMYVTASTRMDMARKLHISNYKVGLMIKDGAIKVNGKLLIYKDN